MLPIPVAGIQGLPTKSCQSETSVKLAMEWNANHRNK